MRLTEHTALTNTSRRRLLQLAALGAAAALLPACRDQSAAQPGEGDRFPEFALPGLDGRKSSLSAYANSALVVNFWATWCEPCRREMPDLEKLSALFRPEDLRVIGVTVDKDVNLAREFSLRLKLTFPLLSDSDQALSSGKLHITGYPMTYLLRRDHSIARIIAGAREWAGSGTIDEIEKLLAVRRIGTA